MRIGIIGAGQIGGTLARRFAALGHEVSIANSRGPEGGCQLGMQHLERHRPVVAEIAGEIDPCPCRRGRARARWRSA